MEYKLSKGIKKAITSALTILVAMIAFSGFADVSIWDLMANYLKPVLGAMTVGGAVTLLLNYLKIKWAIK